MSSIFRGALLLSTLAATSMVLAQGNTPTQGQAVKPAAKPAQVTQGTPAPAAPGGRSQGAAGGQTAAEPLPAWVVPAAIAAGVVAVGAVIANQDDNPTPSTPSH